MKQIILLITAGLVVAGCCSTQNDIQHLSTSDLELRRYELNYCLSMARMSWDKRPWQSNTYDDVKADLEEKELAAFRGALTPEQQAAFDKNIAKEKADEAAAKAGKPAP